MSQDPGGLSVGVLPGLFFVGVLAFGAVLALIVIIQRSRGRVLDAVERQQADVDTGLALLDVRVVALETSVDTPPAGADPDQRTRAGLALADARGRLDAARTLRAESDGLTVSRACRRMLLEGLAACHAGDVLLGLDPGPPPPPPTEAPLVPSPVRVRVGELEYVAMPAYAPGFPYCYSGGLFDVAEVPGGWYAEPFWEQLLAGGPHPEA